MNDEYKRWLKENQRILDENVDDRGSAPAADNGSIDIEIDRANEQKHRRWKKARYRNGRYEGGYFKIPIWAWAAGTWAQIFLSIAWYVVVAMWLHSDGGPGNTELRGLLSAVALIPCAILGPITWRIMGQRARNVVRAIVKAVPFAFAAIVVGNFALKQAGILDDKSSQNRKATTSGGVPAGVAPVESPPLTDSRSTMVPTSATESPPPPPAVNAPPPTPDGRLESHRAQAETRRQKLETALTNERRFIRFGGYRDLLAALDDGFVWATTHARAAKEDEIVAHLVRREVLSSLIPLAEKKAREDLDTAFEILDGKHNKDWTIETESKAVVSLLAFAPADPRVVEHLVDQAIKDGAQKRLGESAHALWRVAHQSQEARAAVAQALRARADMAVLPLLFSLSDDKSERTRLCETFVDVWSSGRQRPQTYDDVAEQIAPACRSAIHHIDERISDALDSLRRANSAESSTWRTFTRLLEQRLIVAPNDEAAVLSTLKKVSMLEKPSNFSTSIERTLERALTQRVWLATGMVPANLNAPLLALVGGPKVAMAPCKPAQAGFKSKSAMKKAYASLGKTHAPPSCVKRVTGARLDVGPFAPAPNR